MKTKNIFQFKSLLSVVCIALSVAVMSGSCSKSEIERYDSRDKLWFTQKDAKNKVVNNLTRSFSHFPGSETLDVPFEIKLIGLLSDQEREYKIVVVDSLTTALPTEYKIQPTKFRPNSPCDTLWIELIKTPRLTTEEVKLTLAIVENENFTIGYAGRMIASVVFNNITTKPEWWTDAVAKSFFGPFSKEKFEAFYAYSGRNEIDGLASSELRKLLLGFRDYIKKNNITEADGSAMVIPIQ